MWSAGVSILLVAYLPGLAVFRLPVLRRELRVLLPLEERVFWYTVLSLAVTSTVGLALAAAGLYRFEWLLSINGTVALLFAAAGRGRLRLSGAPRLSWSALVPLAVIVVAASTTLGAPPAEYLVGGKDPGIYMIEGIQIAQSGSLRITDPLVASIPDGVLDLFAGNEGREHYYGSRFMGFYLLDPEVGLVTGQFPHLYPFWVAVGYGVNGLIGARYAITMLAIVGVLAVYFAGVSLVGRPAAAAGALLLSVNVAQVWYGRYPNAEIVLQLLTFAAVLAYVRTTVAGDRFFTVVAAVLLTLAGLTHLTGAFLIVFVLFAMLLNPRGERGYPWLFTLLVAAGGSLVALYYSTIMAPYVERFLEVIGLFPYLVHGLVAGLVAVGGLVLLTRAPVARVFQRVLPWTVVAFVWGLAAYAYFLRSPRLGLAVHDADSVRTFVHFYLSPLGMLMTLAGFAVLARRRFWSALPFMCVWLGFTVLFFYKMRVIPEHFWAVRRFLAVTLPGACLLIGTAAFPFTAIALPEKLKGRGPRVAAAVVGALLVAVVGGQYLSASTAIRHHVEYEDAALRLEEINAQISDRDLVLVESRQASDLHTLALPLAYIYGRQVLVLRDGAPDQSRLTEFLAWAWGRYERVLFVGGGGTLLLSPTTDAVALSTDRFVLPEYDSAYHAYPSGQRLKRFDVSLYRLVPRLNAPDDFDLDVGEGDDLLLRRFHIPEVRRRSGVTYRWTRDTSFVTLFGVTPDRRTVTVWLSDGGRPESGGPASVELVLNESSLGIATATRPFEAYQFEIPAPLAAELEVTSQPALLRLSSTTWNPGEVLGAEDRRQLGVMVDRITLD